MARSDRWMRNYLTDRSLGHRLGKAFVIQAALISVAAILGVNAAGFVLEEVLLKQALRQEANYFWSEYERDPKFPAPDTRNLTGYVYSDASDASVPTHLRGLAPGWHSLPQRADYSVAMVTERAGSRLLLVFDGENVGELAFYFGLVPLAGVLVVLYLGAWITYRQAHRAVSPIIALAQQVRRLNPEDADPALFDPTLYAEEGNHEVRVLADALARFAQHIEEFVERERAFTRDASHELRSPLTVIKLAADMLLSEQELSRPASNSVRRIKRAAADMEELVEAFLILARESEQGFSHDPVSINGLVDEEVRRAMPLLQHKGVEVAVTADVRLFAMASEKVLSVLIGNLVRNAFSYTDQGRVSVHVGDRFVRIKDSGVGMAQEEVEHAFKPFFRGQSRRRGGYGVGLTIVKRLSDRFGWPVSIDSQAEVGTTVTVRLPAATVEPL